MRVTDGTLISKLIYRTTSISAHAYYYSNEFCDKKRSIFYLKKPSIFEQFLEIFGIFEQRNLDLKQL